MLMAVAGLVQEKPIVALFTLHIYVFPQPKYLQETYCSSNTSHDFESNSSSVHYNVAAARRPILAMVKVI